MHYFYQILVNGLHNGALYALLAFSYGLLHMVVPKPNLAHGAFFAMAGQVAVLATGLGYNALVFTFASSVGFGVAVALLLAGGAVATFALAVLPRLARRAPNAMIVTTLAIAIVLMEAVRIGADGRDMWLPPLSTIQVPLGAGASLTLVQVCNLAAIAAMLAVAQGVLNLTSAGRALRATAQSPAAARLCGVNVDAVTRRTALAAGLMSAFGGVLAVMHFGNMSFGAGLTYGLKVLFIAAAGGFASPLAGALAAFAYGEAEALWDGYMPIMWRDVFFFAALALLLILRGRTDFGSDSLRR